MDFGKGSHQKKVLLNGRAIIREGEGKGPALRKNNAFLNFFFNY